MPYAVTVKDKEGRIKEVFLHHSRPYQRWHTVKKVAEEVGVPEESVRNYIALNQKEFEEASVGGIKVYKLKTA
jgi:hypothetical protein